MNDFNLNKVFFTWADTGYLPEELSHLKEDFEVILEEMKKYPNGYTISIRGCEIDGKTHCSGYFIQSLEELQGYYNSGGTWTYDEYKI